MDATLILDAITIRYGRRQAVAGLSLEVRGGEIYGLLGPNGSGKSSTISAIAGVLEPASGDIRINGVLRREEPDHYARLVGYVPQEIALYEELTVVDNLRFFGHTYGVHGRRLTRNMDVVLDRVGLADRRRCSVGSLSGGMQRRVNLAAALLHDPRVLLLDEPTVALDPASRDNLFQTLSELRSGGCAIVLTTHHLDEAEQWCDRVGVLRQGRLAAEGSPADALHDHRTRSTILGILREELAEETELAVRNRLGPDIDFSVTGRRIRLIAPDGERLGLALTALHGEGIELESFRTPPARLDVENDHSTGETLIGVAKGESCVVG